MFSGKDMRTAYNLYNRLSINEVDLSGIMGWCFASLSLSVSTRGHRFVLYWLLLHGEFYLLFQHLYVTK